MRRRPRSAVAPARVLLPFALAAWLLLPGVAAAQDDPRPLAGTRVAAQVGAGVLVTPVAFVAAGKLTEMVAERMGAGDPRASRVALVGAWTGAALATAAAPAAIGARGPGTGSYAAALGGTLAGGAGSWAIVRFMNRGSEEARGPCRVGCALAALAVLTLPSVGATVGFNLSRRER